MQVSRNRSPIAIIVVAAVVVAGGFALFGSSSDSSSESAFGSRQTTTTEPEPEPSTTTTSSPSTSTTSVPETTTTTQASTTTTQAPATTSTTAAPEPPQRRRIGDLAVGDVAYTSPRNVRVDDNGTWWLGTGFQAQTQPSEQTNLKIKRLQNGFEIWLVPGINTSPQSDLSPSAHAEIVSFHSAAG